MMPGMLLEISMVRRCLETRNSLLRILIKTAGTIVEIEMIEVTEVTAATAATEVVMETVEIEVIEVIEETEVIEEIEVIEAIEVAMETEEEETEMTEEEEMTEERTEDVMETAIDQRDEMIVTIEEEGHHHQANASGVEKQVIGKNNHLRRERGEVWLIGIGHDSIWYPL